MKGSFLVAAGLLAACGTRAPEPPPPDPCREAASDARTYGEPALDALAALAVDPGAAPRADVEDATGPARVLFETDVSVILGDSVAPRLERALDAALATSPAALPASARVALQNDVWGLWQRLDAAEPGSASPRAERLAVASARLTLRLAPSVGELDTLRGDGLPAAALARLPASAGWRERGTEHSVFSHEVAFGLRRVFRVLTRQDERDRAFVSQLVALDAEGGTHLTSIAGGIELVELSGARPRVEVHELSRRALRCGGPALLPMDAIHGLPGLGTGRFLARLDPPAAPEPAVCARCHEDLEGRPDLLMSLPNDDLARLPRRRAELLAQASGAARALVEDARRAP